LNFSDSFAQSAPALGGCPRPGNPRRLENLLFFQKRPRPSSNVHIKVENGPTENTGSITYGLGQNLLSRRGDL
jgi:hypothetical protein